MPSTFSGIREDYGAGRAVIADTQSLESVRDGHNSRVASQPGGAMPHAEPKSGPSPIKRQIQQAHDQLLGKTDGAIGSFDARARIAKTPDGTLRSENSAFVQAGKQAAGDADLTLDAAKDAVKNLLKRDR